MGTTLTSGLKATHAAALSSRGAQRGIALVACVTLPPGSPCDCECAALGAGVVAWSGAEAAEAAEEAAALAACLAVVPVVDGHLHVHSKP